MISSDVTTPEEYIASLPDDRREAVATVCEVVRANLPAGYKEGIQYGMIGWYVPLERFPDTYNGQPLVLAALASQKNHISLYLNTVYGSRETEAWCRQRFAASGKRLDRGKSCVRFRRVEDLPLELIGETIARADVNTYLAGYQAARGSSRKIRAAASR